VFRKTLLPPSSFHPEDGGTKVLRNVGFLPQHYTASQPRSPRFEFDFSFVQSVGYTEKIQGKMRLSG